jgi:hypothetical protein
MGSILKRSSAFSRVEYTRGSRKIALIFKPFAALGGLKREAMGSNGKQWEAQSR